MSHFSTNKSIVRKAAELNIDANLLFVCLHAIVENRDEVDMREFYFKFWVEDIRSMAEHQMKSKIPYLQELGKTRLLDFETCPPELLDESLLGIDLEDPLLKPYTELKVYHLVAFEKSTSDIDQFKEEQLLKNGDNRPLLEIVKDRCEAELKELKDIASIFDNNIYPN